MRIHFAALAVLLASLAGCISANDSPQAQALPAADTAAAATAPITETIEGSIITSAAIPSRTFNFGGEFVGIITPAANISGFIFEVEWSPASPASQELSLWVRPAGVGAISPDNAQNLVMAGGPTAQTSGGSPLRIAMAADQFTEEGDYEWVVRAAGPPGIAVNQPFTMHLTTFLEVPFDEDFTATDHHA